MYCGLLKPNRICRLGETSEPSMEEIHRHVHQFVHDTRNLWKQGQCSIEEGRPRTLIVQEIEYRLDVLRAVNSAHVKVYEAKKKT